MSKENLLGLTLSEWFYVLKIEGFTPKESGNFVHVVLQWPKLFLSREVSSKLKKNPVNLERLADKINAKPNLPINDNTLELIEGEILTRQVLRRKPSQEVLQLMSDNNWTIEDYILFQWKKSIDTHMKRVRRIRAKII